MPRFLLSALLALAPALTLRAADWPTFLGPTRDGVSARFSSSAVSQSSKRCLFFDHVRNQGHLSTDTLRHLHSKGVVRDDSNRRSKFGVDDPQVVERARCWIDRRLCGHHVDDPLGDSSYNDPPMAPRWRERASSTISSR